MSPKLNRAQRRQLAKKIRRYAPDENLAKWLAGGPGKVVKRAELWAVLDRFWKLKELEEAYYSPMARFQRFVTRLAPWMADPPESPFERGLATSELEEIPERE